MTYEAAKQLSEDYLGRKREVKQLLDTPWTDSKSNLNQFTITEAELNSFLT